MREMIDAGTINGGPPDRASGGSAVRRAFPYAGIFAFVLLATWVRQLLFPTLGYQFPFLLYFPIVIGAAWWGGPGPTLLALVASVPLAMYYFIPRAGPLGIANGGGWTAVGVYVMVGLGLTFMSWRRQTTEQSRDRAQTELSNRDLEIRLLTDALPGLMCTLDAQERYVLVNRFAEQWYGLPESEILGRTACEVLGDQAYRRIAGHIGEGLAGKVVRFEDHLRYRTGEQRWVEALYVPRVNGRGEVTGLYVMATDITQRRGAEQALRDSEERFRELADAMPQMVWTADAKGKVNYVNRRWHEYAGSAWDEMDTSRFLHPEDVERARTLWSKAVSAGEPYQQEVRLRSSEGNYRWFLVRAVAVRDGAGALTKWYGTSTDINDQKLTEGTLARAVEDLNRSNKELEDFAYLTSHDLKEPVRGIRSYTSFVLEDTQGTLEPEVVRKLNVIDRLGERMDRLIGTLLYYTQIGRAAMPISRTDLAAVVASVIESEHHAISAAGAQVTVAGPLPVIECDPTRAAEVFRHLIANALRFNTSGRPVVEIGALEGEGWPVLCVRDNGIGIAPEHHQIVFRMFKRLHAREDFGGGMGAGLAFVKKIVERHRGITWIEAAPGGGTTVCFTLGRALHAVHAANSDC